MAKMTILFRFRMLPGDQSSVQLSCPSPGAWLLCVWVSPSGHRSCNVINSTVSQLCSNSRSDIVTTVTRSGYSCDLDLVVTPADHGTWTCMLTLAADHQFNNLVTKLALAVTVTPQLRYKNFYFKCINFNFSVETNQSHVTCRASHGYPAPHIYWLDTNNQFIPHQVIQRGLYKKIAEQLLTI